MIERDLLVFLGWLAGLVLMMWRLPDGAEHPWALRVIGAGIWCALPLWEPSMRTVWYFVLAAAVVVPQVLRWPQSALHSKVPFPR